MTLDLLENTQMAKILNFNVTQRLLERFFSLGLYEFKTIKKIESSLESSTILIECNKICLMLRYNETKGIEVERI